MKNHKNCEILPIGKSTNKLLTLVGHKDKQTIVHKWLQFEVDGDQKAYIADANTEIPPYYKRVAKFTNWLTIYDDFGSMQTFRGKAIKIYRAGKTGCIVQIMAKQIDKSKWNKHFEKKQRI